MKIDSAVFTMEMGAGEIVTADLRVIVRFVYKLPLRGAQGREGRRLLRIGGVGG